MASISPASDHSSPAFVHQFYRLGPRAQEMNPLYQLFPRAAKLLMASKYPGSRITNEVINFVIRVEDFLGDETAFIPKKENAVVLLDQMLQLEATVKQRSMEHFKSLRRRIERLLAEGGDRVELRSGGQDLGHGNKHWKGGP